MWYLPHVAVVQLQHNKRSWAYPDMAVKRPMYKGPVWLLFFFFLMFARVNVTSARTVFYYTDKSIYIFAQISKDNKLHQWSYCRKHLMQVRFSESSWNEYNLFSFYISFKRLQNIVCQMFISHMWLRWWMINAFPLNFDSCGLNHVRNFETETFNLKTTPILQSVPI